MQASKCRWYTYHPRVLHLHFLSASPAICSSHLSSPVTQKQPDSCHKTSPVNIMEVIAVSSTALGLKTLFCEIISTIRKILNAPKYFASIESEIQTLDQIVEGVRNNSKSHPNPNSMRTLQSCLLDIMATCTEVKNLVNVVMGCCATSLRGAWEKDEAVALLEKLERHKSSLLIHRQEMM